MFTPHCQGFTFFCITMVTGLHSLSAVPQTTQLFQNGKCYHPHVKGWETRIDVVESDQKLCSQLNDYDCTNYLWRLAVAVPTISGGLQWLCQLSVEVLWPAEFGIGCANSVEIPWPAQINSCTNCLWQSCDLQRLAVALPTISRAPSRCPAHYTCPCPCTRNEVMLHVIYRCQNFLFSNSLYWVMISVDIFHFLHMSFHCRFLSIHCFLFSYFSFCLRWGWVCSLPGDETAAQSVPLS